MPTRCLILAVILALAPVAACTQTPTEVYVDMTTCAQMGDREGFLRGFTARSRDLVEALISLAEAYGMEDENPYELLVFDSVDEAVIEEGGERAVLHVRRRGATRKILMVKDDEGDWRIDTQELEDFWDEEGRQ